MITRSQMRRQLRAKGGIMNVASGNIGGGGYTGIPMGSRTGFGIISKIKDRVRKLIPNELADVAVKAAPFVAPFFPGYAAIARGLGRFDQRGSISDALKQGLGTYAGGQLLRGIGGGERQLGFRGADKKLFTSPLNQERTQAVRGLFQKQTDPKDVLNRKMPGDPEANIYKNIETKPTGIMKKATEATIDKIPFADKLPQEVKEKLLVGSVTSGASALYSYFAGEFEPQQPGESMEEYMARRNQRVKQQMRGYMDSYYTPLRNPQYAAMSDEQKDNYIDSIVGQGMATGGRVGLMGGTMPMGEPRVNQGGITELDYRAKGGFVPVGIKEKADDVPAMLSKNEFVFTADAVRGAGNGSVEKGAQKMYDTMKNLERRVT